MSRKKSNNEKILEILKPLKTEIRTTELANKTGIDIKNITRYLKDLESQGLISRNTVQDGKIRVVLIKYITSRIENTTSRSHFITSRKEEVKPEPSENVMYELSTKRLKPKMIFGDKDMDKGEIINWISDFIKENEKQYTLDFLRGQKLIYETINEMRKK